MAHAMQILVSEQSLVALLLQMAMDPLNAMKAATGHLLLCLIWVIAISAYGSPVVVNTWPFVDATSEAWRSLLESADSDSAALTAVEQVRFSCLHQRWTAKLRPVIQLMMCNYGHCVFAGLQQVREQPV